MNEEMRKEFEEWFSGYCNDRGFNYSFAALLNGEYASWPEHNAFLGWKASREAMRPIRLPTRLKDNDTEDCYAYNLAIDDCKEAIESAGYKVAP